MSAPGNRQRNPPAQDAASRWWRAWLYIWRRVANAYKCHRRELVFYGLSLDTPVTFQRKITRGRFLGLRVLNAPDEWEPVAGVPPTRSQCPGERPCPRIHCKWNTLLVASVDRPGRRSQHHRLPSPVLVYREKSCAFDAIQRSPHGMTCDEVGSYFGTSGERVLQICDSAIAKIEASGFDARGWQALLDEANRRQGR